MEMRKTVLYGVLAFCLVVLNSCLGDPATQLTMANQAGVVVTGYGPGKAIYTKGDVVVSSEDFQNANVENGECILFAFFPPGAFRLYQRQFVPVHGDKQSPGKPSGQFLFVL